MTHFCFPRRSILFNGGNAKGNAGRAWTVHAHQPNFFLLKKKLAGVHELILMCSLYHDPIQWSTKQLVKTANVGLDHAIYSVNGIMLPSFCNMFLPFLFLVLFPYLRKVGYWVHLSLPYMVQESGEKKKHLTITKYYLKTQTFLLFCDSRTQWQLTNHYNIT